MSITVAGEWGVKFTLGKGETGVIFHSANGLFAIFVSSIIFKSMNNNRTRCNEMSRVRCL
jgi:hypothetical protein